MIKLQCAIFDSGVYGKEFIQKRINDWLSAFGEEIEVVKILQSEYSNGVTLTIFYKLLPK